MVEKGEGKVSGWSDGRSGGGRHFGFKGRAAKSKGHDLFFLVKRI